METTNNQRTVSGATSLQQNVAGSLQAHCTQTKNARLRWLLFFFEGFGAQIDYTNQVVSVPRNKAINQVAKAAIEIRRHGWHTQIGVI